MGGAGRESFAPAYGGADDQNVEYNTNIGEEDWEEVSKRKEYSGEGQNTDIDGDIGTRQREEGGQLTGVVVDGLGLTEVQVNSQKHNDDCIKKSTKSTPTKSTRASHRAGCSSPGYRAAGGRLQHSGHRPWQRADRLQSLEQ